MDPPAFTSWKSNHEKLELSLFLFLCFWLTLRTLLKENTHTEINFAYKGSCFVVIFAEMFISEKKDKAHLE